MKRAPPPPLVRIFNDALPAAQYRALERAVLALGTERLIAGYQTTFWYELGSAPTCFVEEAVAPLAKYLPELKDVTGVEWWLSRMRTSNVKVDFHRDRDNALWDQKRVERHPKWSSLLYLSVCRGGLLAVTRQKPNARNRALAPTRHDFDFVQPWRNRFTYFRGNLTHGVLDSHNQIPGTRRPLELGYRIAIAINFWARRPLDVPTFPESRHYRLLSLEHRAELERSL